MTGNRMVPTGKLRDRSGVALPLALFGLVAVTVMVTAALLTSTTEAAMSGANLDATRTLYTAESAVQSYVAMQGAGLQSVTDFDWTVPGTTDLARINVVRVARVPGDLTANPPYGHTDKYAVSAQPLVNGRPGRGVVAMVTLPSGFTQMNLNVNAGATVGSDLTVGGNSKVVDRSASCADSLGAAAVVHESGTAVVTEGSGTISGAVEESTLSGHDFVRWILNGKSLYEYASVAEIQFGPMFGKELFPSSAKARWDATNPKLRWGCPAGMENLNCASAGSQTTYYPSIAIDANGGLVDLQGDHGQGVLMILNGNLKIQGNFLFNGIVIVEGYTEIAGTGGNNTTKTKIEGALVSLGENTSQTSKIAESATMGNAVISYNRCQVKSAQDAFNQNQLANPTFRAPQASFAWHELIR